MILITLESMALGFHRTVWRERESKGLRVTPDFQLEFYGKGNGRFLTTLEKMAMTLVWDIVSI